MYGAQPSSGKSCNPEATPISAPPDPASPEPEVPDASDKPSAAEDPSEPAWLTFTGTYSLSILCLQASALSTTGPDAEAATLAFGRISAQLGPLRSSPRPGSLSAKLLDLQEGGLPSRGLRISLAGVQLCASTEWESAVSRQSTELPSCMEALSVPVEVQMLVSLHCDQRSGALSSPGSSRGTGTKREGTGYDPITGQDSEAGEPAGWVAAAALGPIQAALSGDQVAAVVAVASGLAAEAARSFRIPLPPRSIGPGKSADLGRPAGLARISLEAPGVSAVYSSTLASAAPVKPDSSLARPDDAHGRLTIGLASLRVGVAAGRRPQIEVGVLVTSVAPVVWGVPNVGIHIPALDVRVGRIEETPTQPEQSAADGRTGGPQSPLRATSFQRASSLVSSIGNLLSPTRPTAAEVSEPAEGAIHAADTSCEAGQRACSCGDKHQSRFQIRRCEPAARPSFALKSERPTSHWPAEPGRDIIWKTHFCVLDA